MKTATWVVCFAFLAAAWVPAQTPALAQDAATLAPAPEAKQGTVQRAERSTKVDAKWEVGDAYKVSDRATVTRDRLTEEFVNAVEGGRATEVWRTYGKINTVRTTYVDLGQGPQAYPVPETDWKADQTFRLKQAADGSRTITHKVFETINEAEQALIVREREPNLLPPKAAKIGDSWDITAVHVGLPFLATTREKINSVEGKATLKSFAAQPGLRTASVSVSVTMKLSLEEKNQFDGSILTRINETQTFEGEAVMDANAGRMLALSWKGSSKFSGEQSGSPINGSATIEESYSFRYGQLNLSAPALQDIGPAKVEGIYTDKHGPLKPTEIVLARASGKQMRMQVYDTATRKLVRTVLAWDGNSSVSQLAISPDRRKVAFASTLNTHISVFTQQVFVLDLDTGKLDQVSGSTATGDGLEQPIQTAKTATLKGRVVWYDDERGMRRDRHTGVLGKVEIDRTPCKVVINADGTFELTNVPVGEPLFIQISGTLPNYSDGSMRGGKDLMAKYVGATILNMQIKEGTHDLGDVRINPYFLVGGYGRPAWKGDELWVQQESWRSAYVSRYKGKEWKQLKFGELEYLTGAFSISPDGKHVAFARDTSGGTGGPLFFTSEGKAVWSTGTILTVSYASEGSWAPTSNEWVFTAGLTHTCGDKLFGAPALGYIRLKEQQHIMPQAWRQLTGHTMVSLAIDESAHHAYFVTHFWDPAKNLTYGDAWHWDAASDTLTRLTGFGDVIAVGGHGR